MILAFCGTRHYVIVASFDLSSHGVVAVTLSYCIACSYCVSRGGEASHLLTVSMIVNVIK